MFVLALILICFDTCNFSDLYGSSMNRVDENDSGAVRRR